MEKSFNKKLLIPLIVIAGVVLATLVTFLIMLCTVKSRVVGIWEREVMYLESYGCNSIMVVEFDKDGSATEILTNADTGRVIKIESGYWKLSGFGITYKEVGQSGSTPYVYNPFTNTLNNGGGWIAQEDDNIYHKVK